MVEIGKGIRLPVSYVENGKMKNPLDNGFNDTVDLIAKRLEMIQIPTKLKIEENLDYTNLLKLLKGEEPFSGRGRQNKYIQNHKYIGRGIKYGGSKIDAAPIS